MPTTTVAKIAVFEDSVTYALGSGRDASVRAKIDELPATLPDGIVPGFEQGCRARIVISNISGKNAKEISEQFNRNAAPRSDIKKPGLVITSHNKPGEQFAPHEALEANLSLIKKLDLQNCPFLIVEHRDKNHQHYHLIISRVDFDGNVVSDKYNFFKLREWAQETEQKYNLTATPSRSQRKELTRAQIEKYSREGTVPPLYQLQAHIDTAVGKPVSEFIEHLESKNVGVQFRFEKEKAVGISFSYSDQKFAGRHLGSDFTWENLQRRGLDYEPERDNKQLEAASARASRTGNEQTIHDSADGNTHSINRAADRRITGGDSEEFEHRKFIVTIAENDPITYFESDDIHFIPDPLPTGASAANERQRRRVRNPGGKIKHYFRANSGDSDRQSRETESTKIERIAGGSKNKTQFQSQLSAGENAVVTSDAEAAESYKSERSHSRVNVPDASADSSATEQIVGHESSYQPNINSSDQQPEPFGSGRIHHPVSENIPLADSSPGSRISNLSPDFLHPDSIADHRDHRIANLHESMDWRAIHETGLGNDVDVSIDIDRLSVIPNFDGRATERARFDQAATADIRESPAESLFPRSATAAGTHSIEAAKPAEKTEENHQHAVETNGVQALNLLNSPADDGSPESRDISEPLMRQTTGFDISYVAILQRAIETNLINKNLYEWREQQLYQGQILYQVQAVGANFSPLVQIKLSPDENGFTQDLAVFGNISNSAVVTDRGIIIDPTVAVKTRNVSNLGCFSPIVESPLTTKTSIDLVTTLVKANDFGNQKSWAQCEEESRQWLRRSYSEAEVNGAEDAHSTALINDLERGALFIDDDGEVKVRQEKIQREIEIVREIEPLEL